MELLFFFRRTLQVRSFVAQGDLELLIDTLVSTFRYFNYFFPCFLDIPLRQVVAEECVAFMLNWRENEYLTLQVPAFLLQSNPYVKVINV